MTGKGLTYKVRSAIDSSSYELHKTITLPSGANSNNPYARCVGINANFVIVNGEALWVVNANPFNSLVAPQKLGNYNNIFTGTGNMFSDMDRVSGTNYIVVGTSLTPSARRRMLFSDAAEPEEPDVRSEDCQVSGPAEKGKRRMLCSDTYFAASANNKYLYRIHGASYSATAQFFKVDTTLTSAASCYSIASMSFSTNWFVNSPETSDKRSVFDHTKNGQPPSSLHTKSYGNAFNEGCLSSGPDDKLYYLACGVNSAGQSKLVKVVLTSGAESSLYDFSTSLPTATFMTNCHIVPGSTYLVLAQSQSRKSLYLIETDAGGNPTEFTVSNYPRSQMTFISNSKYLVFGTNDGATNMFDTRKITLVTCSAKCATCDPTTGANGYGCATCKANMVNLGNGICECADGYRWVDTQCVACAATCRRCKGTATTDCTLCYTGMTYICGSCGCVAGQYWNFGTTSCSGCASQCATCTGAGNGNCETCSHSGSMRLSGGSCLCNTNKMYYHTGDRRCYDCSSKCGTCSGGGASQCTSCVNGTLGLSSNPGSCSCTASNYVYVSSNLRCEACHETCSTCSNTANTGCITCRLATMSKQGGYCKCTNSRQVYISGSPPTCQDCHATCGTCSGTAANKCLTCREAGMTIASGVCSCGQSWQIFITSGCQSCHATCLTCEGGTAANQCKTCTAGGSVDHTIVSGSVGTCTCAATNSVYIDRETGCLPCIILAPRAPAPLRQDVSLVSLHSMGRV